MKKVIIIGAGPAGLTTAYKILSLSKEFEVIILEESSYIGGISKTVDYKGNKMDMGGHRFFSKLPEINSIWNEILQDQGFPSYDDLILNRKSILFNTDLNPETNDNVMLTRNRISRIFFKQNFFDYPISLTLSTFHKLGLLTSIHIGLSFIKSILFKKKEINLENLYINKFSKKLYLIFFKNYTHKVWGRYPNEISADWGTQRVKGLSINSIIKDIIYHILHIKKKTETSLIRNFKYPKFGPGQLWETMAKKINQMGGKIILNAKVSKLNNQNSNINEITYIKDNKKHIISAGYFISSMPLKDLITKTTNTPAEINDIASHLPYRDFITLGLLVKKLNLKNETKIKTINNIIPDNWIYIQDENVKLGRIQIYNNWSPYMVKDIHNTIWLGLEYFCNEKDNLWNMSEKEFANMAINEIIKIGIIKNKNDVLDYHEEKVKKAYPAYFDSYQHIDKIKEYINSIKNLYCIGRNGQHRYNNMDHSMMTGILTAEIIVCNSTDKNKIWEVNIENEYHEK